jgi:hypothetical protein
MVKYCSLCGLVAPATSRPVWNGVLKTLARFTYGANPNEFRGHHAQGMDLPCRVREITLSRGSRRLARSPHHGEIR